VFTCNTYHHLENRRAYFERLRPCLGSGGRIAVVEFDAGGFFRRLSGHYTAREVLVAEMQEAGYTIASEHDFLEEQVFVVFVPTDDGGCEPAATAPPR